MFNLNPILNVNKGRPASPSNIVVTSSTAADEDDGDGDGDGEKDAPRPRSLASTSGASTASSVGWVVTEGEYWEVRVSKAYS